MPTATTRMIGFTMFAVLPTPATAQGLPDLSGTWTLVVGESTFGALPAPESRVDVIEHREPRLTLHRTVAQPGGAGNETNFSLTIDGSEHEGNSGGRTIRGHASWEKQVLVMKVILPTPAGDAEITDRFSLSPDGQKLTIHRHISMTTQGEFDQTYVMKKEK